MGADLDESINNKLVMSLNTRYRSTKAERLNIGFMNIAHSTSEDHSPMSIATHNSYLPKTFEKLCKEDPKSDSSESSINITYKSKNMDISQGDPTSPND